MTTGCNGPYVNGTTGSWCGCNCKCCPPPDMIPCIHYPFSYIPPPVAPYIDVEEVPINEVENYNDYGLELPGPPQTMPTFDLNPIKINSLGGPGPVGECTTVCTLTDVYLTKAPTNAVCGFQIKGCAAYAVGNGYVTITPATYTQAGCGTATLQVNGSNSPAYVTDGSLINLTLVYDVGWNPACCACVEGCPGTCTIATMNSLTYRGRAVPMDNLFYKKISEGQIVIDSNTGRPVIAINKKELLRRIMERKKKSRN